MLERKIERLIAKLNINTRKGFLAWEDTAEEGVYQTSFSNFTVQISQIQEDGEEYPINKIRIFNRLGRLVEEVDSRDAPDITREDMYELYRNARRSAMSAEEAIDTLLSELDGIG